MADRRKHIDITGQIQGIGFRPYIYNLATKLGLSGFVYNHSQGVTIEIQGSEKTIANFLDILKSADKNDLPLLKITSIEITDATPQEEKSFYIKQSISAGSVSAEVTPDIATCKDCLSELFDKNDFRFRYPFINCTNCGPRYSIIKTVPYDRPNTTMSEFKMCDKCKVQYENPADRRFHAQPVACPTCGPKITLCDNKRNTLETNSDKAIAKTTELLAAGKIAAIKGLGGYHLACDATNDTAVKLLRIRKMRDYKPFAIMAANLETAEKLTDIYDISRKVLTSPQSPIVILPKKSPNTIAPSIAPDTNTLGIMLPYTPLHHLLFAEKKFDSLVMTSANISDEPLICKDDLAFAKLADIADIFLTHDREIFRQVDDSVVHIIQNKPVQLRRSRGFVPQAITLPRHTNKQIFAAGADLKNTFCFAKQNRFIVSEHIGDMSDSSIYKHWTASIEHLKKLLDIEPEIFACDLHPGYFTGQYIKKIAAGKKVLEIQHHWAHIASVIAEHNITQKVIGLVADGTGFGTDGTIWGCECLIASLTEFTRFDHLAYYPLPGGDLAAKNAIRPLLALAHKYNLEIPPEIINSIEPDSEKINTIKTQLQKNINTVQTSSLGRLFDAVAALCGLGNKNNYEAQLPITLESIADKTINDYYSFELVSSEILIGKVFEGILTDRKNGISVSTISAKFHNTIAQFFLAFAEEARKQTGINITAISGGVFCNRFLLNRLIELLEMNKFEVYYNQLVPSNDGGISLGQAAIAAFC